MSDPAHDSPAPTAEGEPDGSTAPIDDRDLGAKNPNVLATLTLTLYPDYRVGISGPIDNKPLATYMLVEGHDALRGYHMKLAMEAEAVRRAEQAKRAPNLVLPSGFPRIQG